MHNLQQQLLREDRILRTFLGRGEWAIVPAHDPSDLWSAGFANNLFGSEDDARARIKEIAEIFDTPVEYWTVVEGRSQS